MKSQWHGDDDDFDFDNASEEEEYDIMDPSASALMFSQNPRLE